MFIWVIKIFLHSSSVYSCHLFLISSASVRSMLLLFFIVPIFAWNILLVSLIFFQEISSLSHCIVFLCSFSLERIPMIPVGIQRIPIPFTRKAFFSLLAILWNSAFRWVYLSFFPLPFISLLFSAICKASSDNHFAFLHFFFSRMVLSHVSYTMLQISIHTFSSTLSIRSNSLNLFVTYTV